MNKFVCSALAAAALLNASCSHSEKDGRKYHGTSSPIQGKMGVTYKRVRPTTPPAQEAPAATAPDAALTVDNEPAGLLDRHPKLDEPGAEYWMHGQLSPSPVQSKMGVRVERRKK